MTLSSSRNRSVSSGGHEVYYTSSICTVRILSKISSLLTYFFLMCEKNIGRTIDVIQYVREKYKDHKMVTTLNCFAVR